MVTAIQRAKVIKKFSEIHVRKFSLCIFHFFVLLIETAVYSTQLFVVDDFSFLPPLRIQPHKNLSKNMHSVIICFLIWMSDAHTPTLPHSYIYMYLAVMDSKMMEFSEYVIQFSLE